MKNIYKLFFAAAFGAAFVACTDLDTEPLSSVVTSEQKAAVVAADPSKVEASVTAISANFTVYDNLGRGEDALHCDFGYPALMLMLDSKGVDMVSDDTGYNWFTYSLTYSDVTSTHVVTRMFWTTLYNQIYAANAVTAAIDPVTEDASSQYYLAQALAVRAFDYFTLAQIYQQTYVGHEDALAVPVITEENAGTAASEGLARSTVKDTYEFILKDLGTAIELLEKSGVQRSDKRYVSVDVAYALRARVYMVMNKWSEALADVEAALQSTSATPLSIDEAGKPGFIDIEDHDWLWGVLITEKDRVSTTGICNFASHMGSLNYGYASVGAWRMINKKLFAQIPESDIRRGWFLDDAATSTNLTAAQQAYAAESGVPAFGQVKFAPNGGELGTSNNANDVPLMRYEELLLMKAEAQAMSGNAAAGAETLNAFVQTYRDPDYNCTASSAADVQEAVWNQRRIEFWGEGLSWFDIMRLKKGVNRLGGGFPATAVFNFEPESAVFVYAIPHAEEQSNKLLVNNAPVTRPDPIQDEE